MRASRNTEIDPLGKVASNQLPNATIRRFPEVVRFQRKLMGSKIKIQEKICQQKKGLVGYVKPPQS
jgi:hypothetical protein